MSLEGLPRELVDAFERVELDTKVSKVRRLESQSYHELDSDPHVQIENSHRIADNPAIQNYLQTVAILEQLKQNK